MNKDDDDRDHNFTPSFIVNEDDLLPDSDDSNGLIIRNVYIPEEILIQILSNIEADKLLQYSVVCRKWNNLIKSYPLWSLKYKKKYNRKTKKLPWYVYYCMLTSKYFDSNLLKNGNGQKSFKHWQLVINNGDGSTIEKIPDGAAPVPLDVPEFNGHTSCFATSFGVCHKMQLIKLSRNKLLHHILDAYKPHIYLSEWTAGRFDCGCLYSLQCGLIGDKLLELSFGKPFAMQKVLQWEGREWEKIELTITEYPENVEAFVFENVGRDTQFWKGHYGSKMAGGVFKILSETIEPLNKDELGNFLPRKFSNIKYTCNGLSEAEKAEHQHLVLYDNFRNIPARRH